MNRKMIYGMLWKFVFAIVLLNSPSDAAPAESLPTLTCNVSQQADGFHYSLSRPPLSSECMTSWELKNKTVIARDSEFDKQRVQSLTNQSLTTKDCQPGLHYKSDCSEGWDEASCEVNCSLILDLKDNLTTTVNSTLICITESWCLTKLIFGLGVIAIVIVFGILVALPCWIISKCSRGGSETPSVAYSCANGKNNMEHEEMEEVIIKHAIGVDVEKKQQWLNKDDNGLPVV
ncbi:uncharacterized protein LOC117729223 [Cyclopterus lumpus]|uniref:uncharacterized protein LOC117729223 n=1 Tax=Cyclopterus lumpus TaxID=8103 RepID=UPI001486CFC8|nr:uncharacterized protein LOC117729223 [Cyclopterus lumpus]